MGFLQHMLKRWCRPDAGGWLPGLLLITCGAVAQPTTSGQYNLLHQAQLVADALHLKRDLTVFELLQATYPAEEQPVYPSRIYQDYRGNPYLGPQISAAYQRLLPVIVAAYQPDTTRLSKGLVRLLRPGLRQAYELDTTAARHRQRVEERELLLTNLRDNIEQLIRHADTTRFRVLYAKLKPQQPLPAYLLRSPDRLAVLRDTFLLAVLARVESVASGRVSMTRADSAAMQQYFGSEIRQLRQLDRRLGRELGRLDTLFGTVLLARGSPGFRPSVLEPRHSLQLPSQAPVLQTLPTLPRLTGASLETAALDALSRFIAKRLKEELNAAFFERFNALLHDSSYVELRTLFPNTTRLVTRGSVDYSSIVQVLRTAFDKDLRELFFSFGGLLDQPRYQLLLTDRPGATATDRNAAQLLRYTRVLLLTLDDLQRGTHPLAIIRHVDGRLRQMPSVRPAARQISGVVLTLAEAFASEDKLEQGWVNLATVRQVLRDTARAYRNAFLGLVHQRLLRQAVVLPVLADPQRLYQLVFGFARLATDMQQQVDTLRKRAAASRPAARLAPEDFARLYQLALEMTTFATQYALLHPPPQVLEVERVSQAVQEGYQAALQGRYGVTVTNLLLIANIAMPDQLRNRSQVLKYAPFMAALAEARDPAQMEQAIGAAALPAGSASVKRKTFTSLTLNAFPGLAGGSEFVYLPAASHASLVERGNWRPDIGFTAPIGLCFSRSIRGNAYTMNRYLHHGTALRVAQNYHYFNRKGREQYLKGQSIGFFISVIDLGALVLYRLNDSLNTSPLPQSVTFRQVFSPGLWFMYHAGRSPLSFFAGGQLSPQLRRLASGPPPNNTTPAPVEDRANSLRLNVGVTIDIPLLSFYARSERRQGNADSDIIYQRRCEDLEAVVNQLNTSRRRRKHAAEFRQAATELDRASRLAQ